MKKIIFSILVIVLLILSAWLLLEKFEGAPPLVQIEMPSRYLNKSYELKVSAADEKTGLRNVMVSIMQQGKEHVLLEKAYASPGPMGIFSASGVKKDTFVIPVQAWKYAMIDGDAVIRVMVSDFSWRGWNKGNIFYAEENVVIDTKPPKIKILTRRHNIERGGSGLVIYRLYEKQLKSGVRAGDNYFPGYPGLFDDPDIHAAFFALDHTQGPGTQISVTASDPAGNTAKRGFYHYIRDKRFKTDVLNISDRFLEQKMPEFDNITENVSSSENRNELLDKFLYVNGSLRSENVAFVLSIPEKTKAEKYWQGRFLRLNGAARRAGFADRRIYKYKGREIDRAVHLGIDLASTSNATVGAANAGRIIFTGYKGIFGNMVIIDHGFGLCSLYSHLSHIAVNEGDLVSKLQEIGTTGMSGLAGGDHLHFSMIVHNVFVNPVEWWDKSWIKNNITAKIDEVRHLPNK